MTSWMALREGFDAFTRRFPLLFGAVLVLLAVQRIVDLLIPDSLFWLQSIIGTIVLAPLFAGQYLLALKVVRREPVVFQELFSGVAQFIRIAIAYELIMLLSLLSALALIIPGIIVGLMYSFTLIRFLDPKEGKRSLGVLESLGESARITRGYRGTLFGISLILLIPSILLATLGGLSLYDPVVPKWVVEVVGLLSGALFFGPVQATSYMVVYDYALQHPRG